MTQAEISPNKSYTVKRDTHMRNMPEVEPTADELLNKIHTLNASIRQRTIPNCELSLDELRAKRALRASEVRELDRLINEMQPPLAEELFQFAADHARLVGEGII